MYVLFPSQFKLGFVELIHEAASEVGSRRSDRTAGDDDPLLTQAANVSDISSLSAYPG